MPKLTRTLRILFLCGFLFYAALSLFAFRVSAPLLLGIGCILLSVLFLLFFLTVLLGTPASLVKLCVWMHLFFACTTLQVALTFSTLSGLSFIGVPLFCVLGIFLNLPGRAGHRVESLFPIGTQARFPDPEATPAPAREVPSEDPYGHACLREEILSLKAFLEGRGHYLRYASPASRRFRLIVLILAVLGGLGCILYASQARDSLPMWSSPIFWILILGFFLLLFGFLQLHAGLLRGAVYSALGFLLLPLGRSLVQALTPFFYRSPLLCVTLAVLVFLVLLLLLILALELYRATHYTGVVHYVSRDGQAGAVLDDLSLHRIPDYLYSMEMQMAVPRWMEDEQVDPIKSLNTLLFHIRRFAGEHEMMLMGYRKTEESLRILFALDDAVTREQAEDWGKQLGLLLIKLHVYNSHVSIRTQPALDLFREELYPSPLELSSIYNEEISRILEQRRTSTEEMFEVVYTVSLPSADAAAAFSSRCETNGWTVEKNADLQNPFLSNGEEILEVHFYTRLGLSRLNLNSNQVVEMAQACGGEMLGWHLEQDAHPSRKTA